LGDIQTSLAEEETSKINPCIYSQPKCWPVGSGKRWGCEIQGQPTFCCSCCPHWILSQVA
jgi:hypothetical protein